jgi:hypothetical protein
MCKIRSWISKLIYELNNFVIWNDDEEVHFVLDQHAELDFYSASSLKQWSADRYVAPLWHIILIPSQPVFAFSLMLHAWQRSSKYQFYNLWLNKEC